MGKFIRLYLIITAILFAEQMVQAQQKFLLEVEFDHPHKSIKKSSVNSSFKSEVDRTKAINQLILGLHAEGYLAAEIKTQKNDSNQLQLLIVTGNKYKWAKLKQGNINEEIISQNKYRDKFRFGEKFSHKATVNVQKKILAEYENHGYPFASVRLDSIVIDKNWIEAALMAEPWNLVLIDSVNVVGKSKISNYFLYNYLQIKPGDLYNESFVRRISKRMKELPFVTEEKPPIVEFSTDKAKITLHLKHRNASSFSGIIGFMPNNAQTGKFLITGDVQLKLNNALGYGEQFDLNWRRLQVQTQSLNVYARYPYLFNTKLGVDGNFDFYTKDSTFQTIGLGIGLQYGLGGTDFVKIFYKRFNTKILDRNQYINATELPPFADAGTNNIGVQFYRERLDYRLNPLKGTVLSFTGMAGSKTIKKIPEIPEKLFENLQLNTLHVSAHLQSDQFIKIHRRSTLKLGANMAYSYNPSMFVSDLMRLGGLKTIRGFDEESIFSSAYGIATIEARYHIEQNSFVCVFFNGGYTEQKLFNTHNQDWLYGFGAGLNLFTKAGILSVNYALGSRQGRPIEFKTAKIHFGYVGLF